MANAQAKSSCITSCTFAVISLVLCGVTCCHGADVIRDSAYVECSQYVNTDSHNVTANPITASITQWQGIILLVAFGVFGLIVSLIYHLVRTYIYFDAHLLDTFFDAGGDSNFAMVACHVVSKFTWTAGLTWSTLSTFQFGMVGQFWYAAGHVIHIFLFAIVASEIRIKAPGAKTYLQVVHRRFGAPAHVILMIFALLVNIIVVGMVMTEGVNVLNALMQDLRKELISLIVAIAVAVFTVLGGVGGTMYIGYFVCVLIVSVVLVFFAEVYYNPWGTQDLPIGNVTAMFDAFHCAKIVEAYDNDQHSPTTFLSRGGMVHGILLLLSGFSSVFVDQSYWQTAVSAKPGHAVWGLLTGGLAWFALPFCAGLGLGVPLWVWTVEKGDNILTNHLLHDGLAATYVSQRLLQNTGDFLMFTVTIAVVMATVSGEVISTACIIVYDIYQTYISPFNSNAAKFDFQDVSLRTRRAIQNEEYLEYDRRSVILKHAVVIVMSLLIIPIHLIVMAIGLDTPYLFQFLGVLTGCCVLPIALTITWHRVTQAGVCVGVLGGLIASLVTWLVYAAMFPGGLELFKVNTGRWEVMLAANAAGLGAGGLLCVLFSLCCGGCDQQRLEEEEWEKTRGIDNQVLPWAVKYAPEFRNMKLKGIPHFFAVRRTFKAAEITAYIIGVLLSVAVVLVWPACMLLTGDWTPTVFNSWVIVGALWGALAAIFLALVPIVIEVTQTCRQAYYNRKWVRSSQADTRPLEDDTSARRDPSPQPPNTNMQNMDTRSYRSESDFVSTIGPDSGFDDPAARRERWKTFIHLE